MKAFGSGIVLSVALIAASSATAQPDSIQPPIAASQRLEKDDPRLIKEPVFLRVPSGDDLAKYYPINASRYRIKGSVEIKCTVSDQGLLIDCIVLKETPERADFGIAALEVAKTIKLALVDKAGVSVVGRIWQNKINFQ